MTNPKNNQPKGDELKLLTAQTATQANIPAKSTVVIGGVSYTQAQLLAKIASLLAPYQPARDAKQALAAAVLAKKQNQPAVQTFLVEFHAAMVALFGRGSPLLAKFGFNPHKAKATSGGKNVVKGAKAKRTRELRGTLTPTQKAALKAPADTTATVSSTGTVTPAGSPAQQSASEPAAASSGAPTGNGGSTPGQP